MAVFPLIESPCPYKSRLTEIVEGDTCRLCQRQVHDLTGMSGADRRAFLKACPGEVCVSYRVAASTVAAIGALAAAAAVAPPATAQTDPTEPVYYVIVGGIKDGSKAILIEDESDMAIPELPIVYEPSSKTKSGAEASADKPGETALPVDITKHATM